MLIETYRIGKTRFANSLFSGDGSYKFGGRWNSKGSRVAYTAESLAIAILEIVVHFDAGQVQSGYSFASVRFSKNLVLPVEEFIDLPKNWRDSPAPLEIREIGDAWVRDESSLVLRVPATLLPIGFDLINLEHKDVSKLKIGETKEISVDERFLV